MQIVPTTGPPTAADLLAPPALLDCLPVGLLHQGLDGDGVARPGGVVHGAPPLPVGQGGVGAAGEQKLDAVALQTGSLVRRSCDESQQRGEGLVMSHSSFTKS